MDHLDLQSLKVRMIPVSSTSEIQRYLELDHSERIEGSVNLWSKETIEYAAAVLSDVPQEHFQMLSLK